MKMRDDRHFQFYDAGAYDGETEHRIMVTYYSSTTPGQSELVLANEWPAYRKLIESYGWRANNA